MMKKIKWLCIVLISLILTPIHIAASSSLYTNPRTGYGIYIEDDADLLSDGEEVLLISDMQAITEYGSVAFVSSNTVTGDTSTFAKNTYAKMFGTDSGMLFVIDMKNRNIWIYCDGLIYKTITRAYANTITDNTYRYASQSNYYRCASEAFKQAATLLDGGKIAQPMKYITNLLSALILAALINYLLVYFSRRKRKAKDTEIFGAISASTLAAGYLGSRMIRRSKHYDPITSSSSGGSSGGGGGGSSSSGGGGGHSF